MLTQCQKLLDHLEQHKTITTLEATQKFYIMRPSNRIQELKDRGYDIDTEIVYKKREDGSRTHYARYTLRGAANV